MKEQNPIIYIARGRMREIKFRMWSPIASKYFLPKQSAECLIQQLRFNAGYEYLGVPWDHEKDGMVFEQFTGLQDKNGNDIYEGDILRIPAKDNYENKNFSAFEVFFHDNDCADFHIGFQLGRMRNYGAICGGFSGYKFLPATTAKMEIIGTIHDTDLLKE